VTPDGKTAIVGTDAGLVLVSGVDTGTLTQVGSPFSPSFMDTGNSYTLAGINTVAITHDGKYVAAMTPQPSPDAGNLLVLPINAGGFGNPVGQLDNLYIPDNDILLLGE
jgi:hypothetical protein